MLVGCCLMSIFEEIEGVYRSVASGLSGNVIQSSNGVEPYEFTTCGSTGQGGPTQGDVDTVYIGTTLDGSVTITYNGIQKWIVPTNGIYNLVAIGAAGGVGDLGYTPGYGTLMSGDVFLGKCNPLILEP